MTNYEFEHSVEFAGTSAAVWELWSDVSRWTSWDPSLESVVLDGPFEVGGTGTMTIPGQPPIAFTLTEVVRGRGFTDETSVPGALLRFRHSVDPVADGKVRVTHRVEVEGPAAQAMGPMVTSDVPEAVAALARLASSAA